METRTDLTFVLDHLKSFIWFMFHHSELFSENPGYNLSESRFPRTLDFENLDNIIWNIKAGMLVEVGISTMPASPNWGFRLLAAGGLWMLFPLRRKVATLPGAREASWVRVG